MKKAKPITHQINETALKLLEKHPQGVRWAELLKAIQNKHPTFHLKTIFAPQGHFLFSK